MTVEIDEHPRFAAPQMRTAGDIQHQAIDAVDGDQRREARRPIGEAFEIRLIGSGIKRENGKLRHPGARISHGHAWLQPERPGCCSGLQPSAEMCGESRDEVRERRGLIECQGQAVEGRGQQGLGHERGPAAPGGSGEARALGRRQAGQAVLLDHVAGRRVRGEHQQGAGINRVGCVAQQRGDLQTRDAMLQGLKKESDRAKALLQDEISATRDLTVGYALQTLLKELQ